MKYLRWHYLNEYSKTMPWTKHAVFLNGLHPTEKQPYEYINFMQERWKTEFDYELPEIKAKWEVTIA